MSITTKLSGKPNPFVSGSRRTYIPIYRIDFMCQLRKRLSESQSSETKANLSEKSAKS